MSADLQSTIAAESARRAANGFDKTNTLRAALFGVQDGIVSNFALIMGVSGARVSAEAALIAGVAGLVSGALSMAAGEYVSVRTQRELLLAGQPVDGDDLVNPWRATIASFVLFAFGALIPLLPFIFATGTGAVTTSVVLTGLGLFSAGAILTPLTGRSVWRSGLRMLLIGGGAGVAGYLVGSALGVAVG